MRCPDALGLITVVTATMVPVLRALLTREGPVRQYLFHLVLFSEPYTEANLENNTEDTKASLRPTCSVP